MSMPLLYDAHHQRANNLNFLRFLFAVLVILSHSFPLMEQAKQEPLSWASRGVVTFGTVSIMGFFIISGFLITQSWLRSRSVRDYFQKRALRIYPGFIAACMVCYCLVAPLASDSWLAFTQSIQPHKIIVRTLLLQQPVVTSAFRHTPFPALLSGSMWTIPYEFLCYILVPIAGFAGLFSRRSMTLVITLLLCGFNFWLQWLPRFANRLPWLGRGFIFNPVEALHFLAAFGAGCVFYLYSDRIVRSPPGIVLSAAGLLISFCYGKLFLLTLPLCGAYLLFTFAFAAKPNLTFFGKNHDLSYGIYLYAWPTQMLLLVWFGKYLNPWLLFLSAFGLSSAAAWLSWRCVEKPFLQLKPKPRVNNENL